MGGYSPLFSIEVEHTFFSNGRWAGLDFIPAPHTLQFVEKTGLLIRFLQNGVRVFYDQGKSEVLRDCLADPEESGQMTFKAFAREKSLRAFTDLSIPEKDGILFFDNQNGGIDKNRRIRLHTMPYVSAVDFEKWDSPRLVDNLSRRDRFLRPKFITSIKLGEKELSQLGTAPAEVFRQYYLKFQTKATFWKYYLMGSLTEKEAYIADLKQEADFEPASQEKLPGNRMASTFRSKQRIPLNLTS